MFTLLFGFKTSRPSFSLESHDMGRFYKLPPKFAVSEDKANSPLSHCDSSGRRIFEDEVFKIRKTFQLEELYLQFSSFATPKRHKLLN